MQFTLFALQYIAILLLDNPEDGEQKVYYV